MSMPVEVLHEQRWKHDPPDWKAMLHVMADVAEDACKTGIFNGTGEAPPGPWDDEPDKVQWIDGLTDLDCLAVRNHNGAWCGYVGVTEDHPYHQNGEFDAYDVSVHGGVTFADMCDEDAPDGHGICHIPLEGRSPDVWWIGFDCGHAWDLQPGLIALWGEGSALGHDTKYRDLTYVQEQCALLAFQLKAIADHR